jgi:hypothetical protein
MRARQDGSAATPELAVGRHSLLAPRAPSAGSDAARGGSGERVVFFCGWRDDTDTSSPKSDPRSSLGVAVPEAISTQTQSRPQTQGRPQRLTLNSDGKRHLLLNAVALFTFVAGVASFPLGLIVKEHLLATILGMAAFGVGLLAQLYSATREQRIVVMAGVVAGFVGMGLGIAHGGFG